MSIEVKLTGADKSELLAHEKDWFEILPSGVLALHYGDEIRSSDYFAPHAWEYVSSPKKPGQVGPVKPHRMV
ncbi:hypothetical protein [Mycobacteroides abscessus]|uniref:hypothetical protein n=1 Tax=Mycobacteroides abscessus TaxID=36809 RepID=UPI0009A58444|nr:hypothetical protein [Mycobacteroides abscessus]SKG26833.1 Uncharacterised protein [Mycobacteroides abscessus subsp. massiliense]SKH58340.1 Uncharacterised protein [Mycobacteroides abscessus subsp. massiliense]SKH70282.1 Uncharacterised protein [Mycobacteroides abscessus subsp. massiliense]SKI42121.1 Uncharacterised protein [Mycobacteroides abscessus subsp. massiliense]SKI80096.1 Uncharacterised protein [Mycobacteroides abscessus subsp. massiliense]